MSILISTFPDVSNEFTPQAYPLKEFFSQGQVGFYIPLYQRPYSWDTDNVEQLMDDLVKGIESTLTDSQSVSFLGTVILCQEQQKKKNIQPVDLRALPTSVYNVIDGQQRISTLALLATRLYRLTYKFLENIKPDPELGDLVDHLEGEMESLENFFSFSLSTKKAEPKAKPVIVRGNQDEWTLDGEDSKYTSPVSRYLAEFIRDISIGGIDIPDKRTSFGRNLKVMDAYLEAVMNAHQQSESHVSYPHAKKILSRLSEELIWKFDREELSGALKTGPYTDSKCAKIAAGIQISVLYHYLFDRACLSVIYPSSDDWAFDIFQSLNATGTPLTAIETFKPLVVNTVNQSGSYKGSTSERHFDEVDNLFINMDTVEKKAKLTKEFLNVFSLVYEGRSLSNHFSAQRKWLNNTYSDLDSDAQREEFIHRLSNSASYWKYVKWFDHNQLTCYHGLNSLSPAEKQEVVLCVSYLDDAGHRMADTLLSRFYALVIRGSQSSDRGFYEVAKAICAFFTLWRSIASNTGLDEVYRRILSNSDDDSIPKMSWGSSVDYSDIDKLKEYFRSELKREKNVDSKNSWLPKATSNLKYDSAKTVCKFALLVSSHNTIPDNAEPGLMKVGKSGIHSYFDHQHWISSDLKTIEHIAPHKSEGSNWDTKIYSTQLEHSVGNLTLLPTSINSSAGNRSWEEKVLYFKHLALTDTATQDALESEAINKGISLADETIELLTAAKYASHVTPIVEYANHNHAWNTDVIEKRAERVCDLVWDKMWPWLN
ncbi:DUF262 domain-containing protein [Pseudohalioglobus lutimaris]|uniref:DUF262 domain-containing protein n=1 Tax=Pseudohalioglobus lutimaris TaxID=1737061 RepID=A0A2N5WXC2_9GAMM|nr:DUF262 domain-containing HNH endonuclease family protein [Pseudohalioglobus lutimaris]PLW66894.1 DUF262 domain-containing protein [Pseudohalioglobus lutimaris]